MGTVEDNPNTIVLKPTLIGGLLGLSISQICCGGQHAAVLTHQGIIHTWGRGGFGRLGHGFRPPPPLLLFNVLYVPLILYMLCIMNSHGHLEGGRGISMTCWGYL